MNDPQQSHDEASPEDDVCPRCGEYSRNGVTCSECKSPDYDAVRDYLVEKGEA
jgi:ribosomal protein L32